MNRIYTFAVLINWDMDAGDNLINKMKEGLKVSRFFAVVMSPEFFGSGWTNFEWTHVAAQNPTNTKSRIIPIFLRETTLDGKQRIEFPAPFNVLKYLDFWKTKAFSTYFLRLIRRIRGLPPERGDQRTAYAKATFSGSRLFQPFSAKRTFSMAVSRVNGGHGGRGAITFSVFITIHCYSLAQIIKKHFKTREDVLVRRSELCRPFY